MSFFDDVQDSCRVDAELAGKCTRADASELVVGEGLNCITPFERRA